MRRATWVLLIVAGPLWVVMEQQDSAGGVTTDGMFSAVFGDDLVLASPAARPAAASTPRDQLTHLLERADATWQGAFRRAGLKWTPPRLVYTDVSLGSCGLPPEAGYCPGRGVIIVNRRYVEGFAMVKGAEASYDEMAHVVGHEVGHHVDYTTGGASGGPPGELRATCLGGALMHALYDGPPPPRRSVGDEAHGTTAEIRNAFAIGAASGRPHDCDRPLYQLP